MKITMTGEILAADADARTISGRVVPFNVVATPRSQFGKLSFSSGSIAVDDLNKIRLNLEHDRTRPIGTAVDAKIEEDGIYMTFAVVNTQAANDALIEAAAGLRNGFSIEVMANKGKRNGEVYEVTQAQMTGVALVTQPAFDTERVMEIAAVDGEIDEEEEVSEDESASQDVSTVGEKVEETTTVDAPVEASAPAANLNGRAVLTPRSPIKDHKSYLRWSIEAAVQNDPEMASWVKEANSAIDAFNVAAADDSTANNTGLTLPGHLNDWIATTTIAQPVADACGGYMALPQTGMSFTIPRQLVAPTVATTNEAANVSETGMTSDYLTVSVVKKAGRNVVSLELAERSAPAFLPILEDQLRKAHAKDKEAYVIAQLTAGGTAATATAGTLTGLQNFISAESVAAWAALGGEFADQLVTNGSWWTELIKAQDTTGRPLFPEVGATNAPGVANGQSDRGIVYGANLYVSPNVTSGLVDESAFLINRDSVALWESPVNRVQVVQTQTGEIEIMVYNFVAVQVLKAGGIRRFNLT